MTDDYAEERGEMRDMQADEHAAEIAKLKAELETEREMRETAESYIRTIPAMCNGDFSAPCALHVREPIEVLYRKLESEKRKNMLDKFVEHHWTDQDGNPAGGCSTGTGFTISWQNGPLGRGEERKEPNGAFVETIIQAAVGRLQFYQKSKFACGANAKAITHLNQALALLNERTKDREVRSVEGTHNQ